MLKIDPTILTVLFHWGRTFDPRANVLEFVLDDQGFLRCHFTTPDQGALPFPAGENPSDLNERA